jgi:cytidylate kinase
LDEMMERGDIDLDGSQMAIIILRLKNKTFLKAVAMFDTRWPRISLRDQADLPKSAREYLAGIKMIGC